MNIQNLRYKINRGFIIVSIGVTIGVLNGLLVNFIFKNFEFEFTARVLVLLAIAIIIPVFAGTVIGKTMVSVDGIRNKEEQIRNKIPIAVRYKPYALIYCSTAVGDLIHISPENKLTFYAIGDRRKKEDGIMNVLFNEIHDGFIHFLYSRIMNKRIYRFSSTSSTVPSYSPGGAVWTYYEFMDTLLEKMESNGYGLYHDNIANIKSDIVKETLEKY